MDFYSVIKMKYRTKIALVDISRIRIGYFQAYGNSMILGSSNCNHFPLCIPENLIIVSAKCFGSASSNGSVSNSEMLIRRCSKNFENGSIKKDLKMTKW